MSEATNGSSTVDAHTAAQLALGSMAAGEPVGTVLERVAVLAKQTIPGVDEASVTLVKNDQPRTVAFTGPLAAHLDERQYDFGSGPCLDAALSGSFIRIPDMSRGRAYPDFARVAARQGVTNMLAMGLPLATSSVGGLNLYGTHGEPFDDRCVDLARDFAGYAAIAVANVAVLADALEEVAGMRAAIENRAVIEQAKGILIFRQRCSAEEAFRLLVRASNFSNRKLRDVAASLVEASQGSGDFELL